MDALTPDQVEQFIRDGFVRVDEAFPREVAKAAQDLLWPQTGCDPNRPESWTRPVVWLGEQSAEPFRAAVNTPKLHAAFDQLVGKGRWLPRHSLGVFPIRFPTDVADTGDTGWHIDASFPGDSSTASDFSTWRVNVESRGRALLMLFLFSDVGRNDAPTRIRVGSHRVIARMLQPAGDKGLCPMTIDYSPTSSCEECLATGQPGTVYLCHPFLVHAAQVHRGTRPKFMAQPPLLPAKPLRLAPGGAHSPVERAILQALSQPDGAPWSSFMKSDEPVHF